MCQSQGKGSRPLFPAPKLKQQDPRSHVENVVRPTTIRNVKIPRISSLDRRLLMGDPGLQAGLYLNLSESSKRKKAAVLGLPKQRSKEKR